MAFYTARHWPLTKVRKLRDKTLPQRIWKVKPNDVSCPQVVQQVSRGVSFLVYAVPVATEENTAFQPFPPQAFRE